MLPSKVKSQENKDDTASASGGKAVKTFEVSQIDQLRNAIEKVRNMRVLPYVRIFSVKTKSASLSAVDVSQDQRFLAGCFTESSDIFARIKREEPITEIKNDLLVKKFNSLKMAKEYEEGLPKIPSNGSEVYLYGHSQPVTGLKCVSQKGLLMSCSLDKTVRAWSMTYLNTLEVYSGINDEFYCDIDVRRDASYFAACGLNGKVNLFSFDRTYPVKKFDGHTGDVNCVRFHPNGIYIATASDDNSIKLWNTQSGSVARTFKDDYCPRALAFSPDGKYLASYSGGCIKFWDLASGQLLKVLHDSDEDSSSYSLCFSEFGGVLVSGGVQKKLKIWDIKNLSTDCETVSPEGSKASTCALLKCSTLPRRIKLLKFDENNIFTCVTA